MQPYEGTYMGHGLNLLPVVHVHTSTTLHKTNRLLVINQIMY